MVTASSVLGAASLVALLVAITIGGIANLQPELFLRIPKVGFIPWALTGHNLPPYFTFEPWKDEAVLNNNTSWLRDGDVVVAVGGKSGTTWMLYCTHQIRVKGRDHSFREGGHPFGDVSYSTPWPDLLQKPGMRWEDVQAGLHSASVRPPVDKDGDEEGDDDTTPTLLRDYWNHAAFPFRIWKSHHTPRPETASASSWPFAAAPPRPGQFDPVADRSIRWNGGSAPILPVKERPGVRFIAMARNGLDTAASMAYFFDAHEEKFRRMWGGFPPPSSGSVRRDARQVLGAMLPGGLMEPVHAGYVTRWWPYRHRDNVLLLHYSDLKRDLPSAVREIASFLGVALTDEEFDTVCRKCSIQHMKTITSELCYGLPLNHEYSFADDHEEGGEGEGADTTPPERQQGEQQEQQEENGSQQGGAARSRRTKRLRRRRRNIMKLGSMTRNGTVGNGRSLFTEAERAKWAAAEEQTWFKDDPAMLQWARGGREGLDRWIYRAWGGGKR